MASTHARPRGLASKALKGAGLIRDRDEDSNMFDLTKATGRKKKHSGHRQRSVDLIKASGSADHSQRMMASRVTSNLSNPLAVRGAALRPASMRPGKVAFKSAKPLDVWREFVQKRYSAEAKYLNLDNMTQDEVLKKYGFRAPPVGGTTAAKEYPVIFKLASQLKPPVETISLAGNNLQSGVHLMSIAHYLPNLRNLSLQDNKIRTWRDIENLAGRSRKLSVLREIIFIGNPLRDAEIQAGRKDTYISEMTRRFPSLEVLDQEAVAKISFVDTPIASTSSSDPHVPSVTSFPFPMAGSFITGVEGPVISEFLTRFFTLFDTQRPALGDVYDLNATFSYTAYTQIPPRARIQGWHTSKQMPNQRKLEWRSWLNNPGGGARDLNYERSRGSAATGLEREVRSLHSGPDEIVRAIMHLPKTRHEVVGAAEKFVIDAWPVGQGSATMLFLSIHGEFVEEPSNGIRSFDRTFVLAHAPAESRSALNNWSVCILSDHLTVRSFSSPEAWKPGPMKLQGQRGSTEKPPSQFPHRSQQAPPPLPPPPPPSGNPKFFAPDVQAQLNAIPDPQRSLVQTVCQRTNLNVKFAIDCLEMNRWDLEKAIANFEQVKNTLGSDAYL